MALALGSAPRQLIDANLYGVRLIAPAIQTSCYDDGESRRASSSLVRALRRAPPFDGDRFPPFMWGGSRVAQSDVDFIADWIDDGCRPMAVAAPLHITMRE